MSVVIIPAYEPDEALIEITDKLWEYGCRIMVIDDGSKEAYSHIFEKIKDICILLHHPENRGKGAAIKTALSYIRQEEWDGEVIGIMDADGQHRPEDMIRLLEAAGRGGRLLVLGVRRIGGEMPLRSRLGNTVTREVFHLISGIRVSDTQTGLRAFGPELIETMCSVRGERYEYEMNVLLELAKEGIPVKEVMIKTIYRDRENSTSHFRVLRDSVRIYKDLLIFTLSSLSSFFLDYLLFSCMLFFLPQGGGRVILANVAARLISAYYNYSMNCRFVFHTRRRAGTAADYFLLAGGILLLNNLILECLARFLPVSVYIAKLMTEGILFAVSWLFQNKVIFRKEARYDKKNHMAGSGSSGRRLSCTWSMDHKL